MSWNSTTRNGFGRFCFATLLIAMALTAGVRADANLDDKLLSPERWREDAFGLSLRPPLGSRLMEHTADSAVLRIAGEPGYQMAVHIRASEQLVDVAQVQQYALEQVALAYPAASILEQRPQMFRGQPGLVCIFALPADPRQNRGRWVVGQTVIQLDPTTVAMVQVEMPFEELANVRPIYDAVVRSIDFEDPMELHRARMEAVDRGTAWLLRLDARRLHQARIAEQWFRIVDKQQEIGYIHIRQQAGVEMAVHGLSVVMVAWLQTGPTITESKSVFFLSDDLDQELWSINTTVRAADAAPVDPLLRRPHTREATWKETGTRSGAGISIVRESPSGKREFTWERPDAYLPQVAAHQMAYLLPRDPNQIGSSELMGFYCYYPNNGKISYRTERVQMNADGSFRVFSRPTPEQQEQISEFDAQGRLIRRTLPSGWILLPTTESQVRTRWNSR